MKDINTILNGFQKMNLLVGTPRYSDEDIQLFEKNIGIALPEDYKTVMKAGYIDKGNFHFVTPNKYNLDDTLIVFGSWNDDLFMFDTKEGNGNYPVCVTVGSKDKHPEKRFSDFYTWFESVLKANAQTGFQG
jgi:hypothetical protein